MLSHNDVIVVVLMGGLGNQLFQYAAGRKLAEDTCKHLWLDTVTGFRGDRRYQRSYELDSFSGPKRCEKIKDIRFIDKTWLKIRNKRISTVFPKSLFGIIDDGYITSLNEVTFRRSSGVKLFGYWQDETYFKEIRSTIVSDLVSDPYGVVSSNDVALHVRRKDYSRGVGDKYYLAAINLVAEKLGDPVFRLFTDDLKWGESFAQTRQDVICMSREESTAVTDFNLLLKYKHFIISNSTFSWWPAWLKEQPDSVIVCPGKNYWSNPKTPVERWLHLKVT